MGMDYRTHPDFLAFCAAWERDGRASLPGADLLREWGLDGQADAWEWAAAEPDRDLAHLRVDTGGVRPFICDSYFPWSSDHTVRSGIPADVHKCLIVLDWPTSTPTFPAAVAAFLDAWAVARRPAPVGGT